MPTVTGIKAILATYEYSGYTWSRPEGHGTPVIVTYNFSGGSNLDRFGDGYPASASYHKFTAAQRANFRDAADEISAVSGVIFVEVSGTAMINVARGEGTGVGGFASYPLTGPNYTNPYFGEFVIDGTGSFSEGSYEFLAMLHELGHAVGLAHPHEGPYILRSDKDNLSNTVMTYNNEVSGNTFPSSLATLDKKALKYLYGDAVNTNGWTFKQGSSAFEVSGAGRNDTIFGIDDRNILKGNGGNDKLLGREFKDVLIGGSGEDMLRGFYGNDILRGGSADDRLWGGDGRDMLYGDNGHDIFYGGRHADSLYGGGGRDRIDGGFDDDRLLGGASDDTLKGGYGNDVLLGQTGNDLLFGGVYADTLRGGLGEDLLKGGHGNDRLFGEAGHDEIHGEGNQDTLVGADGNDRLFGGDDRDHLFGGDGNDRMRGGAGHDQIHAGKGTNAAWGEVGDDTFLFTQTGSATARTYIKDFGNGVDLIDISAFNTDFGSLTMVNVNAGVRIRLTATDDIILEGYNTAQMLDSFFDFT